jgi:uroporphyrinogen III methyltransferase/synthase
MANAGKSGIVVLVGAGPGDPSLLTRAGAAWLARADVVFHDRLVNPEILHLAGERAELVSVGKSAAAGGQSQARINELLIAACRAGKCVVRLKGGDPLTFARGGEEAEALAEAGCDFRIVPGVTAAAAAAALAGIPLTDRRTGPSVAFVTGHEAADAEDGRINWKALAGIDTLVFYMAVGRMEQVTASLIDAGKPPDTPSAVVRSASTAMQRTVTGTLATIAGQARDAGIAAPALLIVGRNVEMRGRIAWFEKLPLFGRTVIVTRPRGQAGEMSALLRLNGADVIEAPAFDIRPPADIAPLDEALRRIGEFGWLVLTSANAVASVFDRLAAIGSDARALAAVKVAAVGIATAEALVARSIRADVVSAQFTTEALARTLTARSDVAGTRMLLARSSEASGALAEMLTRAGAIVDEVTAYEPADVASLPDAAVDCMREGRPAWLTVTSAGMVPRLQAMFAAAGLDIAAVRIAAIGPVTAERLRSERMRVDAVADPHTAEGLVRAIIDAETSPQPPRR